MKTSRLKRTIAQYAHIKLWQGEAGVESETCVHGVMSQYPWTELKQAKWVARRMLGDLGHDVWSSVFSIADLCPNRDDDYELDVCRFGLLKTDETRQVVKVKPAYYTVQNVVSVFDETWIASLIARQRSSVTDRAPSMCTKADGRLLLTIWDNSSVPSDANDIVGATVAVRGATFTEPVRVDTITGRVYRIPASWINQTGGNVTLKDIPVYDAPVLIGDRSLFQYQAAPQGLNMG